MKILKVVVRLVLKMSLTISSKKIFLTMEVWGLSMMMTMQKSVAWWGKAWVR